MPTKAYEREVRKNFRRNPLARLSAASIECLEVASPWSPAAVAAIYRKWGCCVLRGLLPDLAAEVRSELARMVKETRTSRRGRLHAVVVDRPADGLPNQIMLFARPHETMRSVRRVIRNSRLHTALRAALQARPEFFASMCPHKEARGGMAKAMHQDAAYYLHTRHTLLNCFVHLVPTSECNGCLRIVPGSFKLGLQEHFDSPSDLAVAPDRFPLERALPIRAEPGDVVMFNYLTLHGSLANESERARPALSLQFRAQGDRQRWQSTANTRTLGRPWRPLKLSPSRLRT